MSVLDKIKNRSAVIGVVGLGYVGLPLAVLQAKTGYRVIGVDEVAEKVDRVSRSDNYISDVDSAELKEAVKTGKLSATRDFAALRGCDVVMICVPTPLTKNKEPDISAVVSVTRQLAKYVHPDMLVVL
ncbi:MAG: UDP-N-acetyl-D-glucosamine dehydrogenase, partial [Nitrospirota bacterium]|nr:UDP-N-acetyl-D-glucosamine dehydrogenase [Nitrospirota bacterium]